MKNSYIITGVIAVLAVALFFFAKTANAPEPITIEVGPPNREATTTTPFGEGATTSGTTGENGTITAAALATHNKEQDCWVAYEGIVYDITAWLPRHPGSAAAIAPYCGTEKEFTASFNKQHGKSKDARLKREGVTEGSYVQ